MLSSSFIPERYQQIELFSAFNLPNDVSDRFANIEKIKINSKVENGNALLTFNAKDYETYEFIVDEKIVKKISGENGEISVKIPLTQAKQEVKIINYYSLSPEIKQEQNINFLRNNKSSKTNQKWYI